MAKQRPFSRRFGWKKCAWDASTTGDSVETKGPAGIASCLWKVEGKEGSLQNLGP